MMVLVLEIEALVELPSLHLPLNGGAGLERSSPRQRALGPSRRLCPHCREPPTAGACPIATPA